MFLRLFDKQPNQRPFVVKLFDNHEHGVGPVEVDEFVKSMDLTTDHKENVKTQVSRARKYLEELNRRNEKIEHEGKLYSFAITTDTYKLEMTAIPDPFFHHKRFWAPYRDKERKGDVLVGVLARLFFQFRKSYTNAAGESGMDEVYVRSKVVNRSSGEASKSPFLDKLLQDHKDLQPQPYRQYMSTHDVLGAFAILRMFGHLGVSAHGDRTATNQSISQSINSSMVSLGTSKESESLHLPRPKDSYRYEIGPDGVHDKEGKLVPQFRDVWREGAQSTIHVLLNRWESGGQVFTTIYSNAAAAIEGVCTFLCDERFEEELGKMIGILWSADEPPLTTEIVFVVEMMKELTVYRAETISVCRDEAPTLVPVWP